MSRKELIEKMRKAFEAEACQRIDKGHVPCSKGMAAALDVAVGELLGEPSKEEFNQQGHKDDWGVQCWYHDDFQRAVKDRRSRYLKPKSDPALVAVRKIFNKLGSNYVSDTPDSDLAEIVSAVRNADKGAN